MKRSVERITQGLAIIAVVAAVTVAPATAALTADPNASSLGAVAWGTEIDAPPQDEGPNYQVDLVRTGGRGLDIVSDIDSRVSGTIGGLIGGPRVGNTPAAPRAGASYLDPVAMGQVTFGHGGLAGGEGNQEPLQDGLDRFGNRRRGNGLPTGGGHLDDPTNPVPEPHTVMLLASGLLTAAMVWTLRRRTLATLRAQG